ncbi:MAG: efflux RND transporter periplasmic adaptor subunit [Phycisphaeraceae bacterium]|nr:efflux RND transporter periplasmic adaptor subunit [Phycisphaeraceae bacterium]
MINPIPFLAAALSAAISLQPPSGPPPAMVKVDAARTEMIEQWREVTGELRVLKRSVIASRQEGQVVRMLVDEGETVKAGDVLASLDEVLATIEVRRAEAELASKRGAVTAREAELDRAQRDWSRYEALDNRTVADRDIDAARSGAALARARLDEAHADVAGAEAALASARERLSQMVIRAPFGGRVVHKMTEVGQWLRAGDAVVEVMALEQIEARLDVPEELAAALMKGGPRVKVRVKPLGMEVQGSVLGFLPEADRLSRLVPLRVVLANEDEIMRPGMSVVGLVATGRDAMTVTVSKDGILRDDAGEYLYFDAGGVAAPVRVRTRFGIGDRVAVDANMPPGAMVIVQGNERLFPGQPLMVIGGGPTDGAPGRSP